MPTSVHKLICSLFNAHLPLLNVTSFKDENTNRLENELEMRNSIEKSVPYGFVSLHEAYHNLLFNLRLSF